MVVHESSESAVCWLGSREESAHPSQEVQQHQASSAHQLRPPVPWMRSLSACGPANRQGGRWQMQCEPEPNPRHWRMHWLEAQNSSRRQGLVVLFPGGARNRWAVGSTGNVASVTRGVHAYCWETVNRQRQLWGSCLLPKEQGTHLHILAPFSRHFSFRIGLLTP